MDEGSVEDISRAESVGGVDRRDVDVEAAAALPTEDGAWSARECDAGNAARREPIEERVGQGEAGRWLSGIGEAGRWLIGNGEAGRWLTGNNEALTADGRSEQGSKLLCAGLPTAAVETERGTGVVAGGEKGQSLREMEAVGEEDAREWRPIGGERLLERGVV